MKRLLIATICLLPILLAGPATGDEANPYLQDKADQYQEWLEEWHSGDLGGLTTAIDFTDATRTEINCVHYQGDSMIWTGMYLGSQALRYMINGDEGARAEVLRIVGYMHDAMDITDTPGYLARYAGLDQWPWNCNIPDGHGWKNHGVGEWDGYFWVDHTSRDQYAGYIFGMSLAYDAVDDEQMRATIREDLAAIIEMLVDNWWNITDQNGQWTGNGAAWIGPAKRLAWLAAVAHVMDEPYYWDLLDQQYDINKPFLPIDTSSFLNRYMEYYGNNLRHLDYASIFRFWPDRERLEHLWQVWQENNRPWVEKVHNPWYDAVHVIGCTRLDVCDAEEMDWIRRDAKRTLGLYWDPPNYKRSITCSTLPLDPFSVAMDALLNQFPWMRDIINIHPQTAQPRELTDRHWTDMYWQSGGVFEASCHHAEDQTFVGAGFDYLIAYYMSVYYGLLPGNAPDDDETADDDAADDDALDDDAIDDDVADDDVVDDDLADDDAATDDDDDDNDDGCGC